MTRLGLKVSPICSSIMWKGIPLLSNTSRPHWSQHPARSSGTPACRAGTQRLLATRSPHPPMFVLSSFIPGWEACLPIPENPRVSMRLCQVALWMNVVFYGSLQHPQTNNTHKVGGCSYSKWCSRHMQLCRASQLSHDNTIGSRLL